MDREKLIDNIGIVILVGVTVGVLTIIGVAVYVLLKAVFGY